ncbi:MULTISPECIES: flagellar assembly protein FliH [Symbiopectobacterium]|uniref:flagellar assembly protein FliH n=1 Tax=Symbiopectobacterium TaxID=801 RepID=UPI001A21010D|nr:MULTISPECIES: flagellar assembly protein FliH [Symbiopectobacterium]MBG6248510.1 flagellar assembly protein FliH [Candidatus Symbiopectobacterium sp. PLON1]MBT9430872.1 flagellar assembly protein FliH [Candidatus Symbiopectobacterium endolongispinus]
MSDAADNMAWKPWKLKDLASPFDAEPEPEIDVVEPEEAAPESVDQFRSFEAELESMREQTMRQAREAGFAEGRQQDYDAGYQEGLTSGTQQGTQDALLQQQPMIEHMQQLVSSFQQTLDAMDSAIPARLTQLALTVAKQIIGQASLCDGTALQHQIQQLIQQEPLFSGKAQLRVNPSDLERVEAALGPTLEQHGWRLLADGQLHPGGCKVSAEEGDLDASLATRWHELCRLAAPGEL